jgi:TPR repeat protein
VSYERVLYNLDEELGEKRSRDLHDVPAPDAALPLCRDDDEPLRGDTLAHIGMCYARGLGNLPKEPTKAAEYFRQSAYTGSALGAFMLGTCHINGVGVPFNAALAEHFLKLATSKGHNGARNLLTEIFQAYGKQEK